MNGDAPPRPGGGVPRPPSGAPLLAPFRAPIRALLALALAIGLAFTPGLAPAAAAATGRLIETASATYMVDPAAGAVHVSIAVSLQNDKPSTPTTYFFWREVSWAIPPEASRIAVSDSGGGLAVTSAQKDRYIELGFRLRRDLLFGQTTNVMIAFDLASGLPRSDSPVRVGEAFATFEVWAWGDSGRSSVAVILPSGFAVETFGSDLVAAETIDGTKLSATAITDPVEFWAAVAATRDRSFARDELALPGGVALLVRAWPEDRVWRTRVMSTLREGLPRLQALIGLPWPVTKRVEVTEVYAPLLEGYAGLYYTAEQRIDISENLDDLTIVHEASHAWLNDGLFTDRWIGEGMADTFAAEVLVEIGDPAQAPEVPDASAAGRVDLQGWTFPGRVDDVTEARELFGYNASWYVVHRVFDEIGPGAFRDVLAAADANRIAYVGAGPAEAVDPRDSWQRFLDLLEEVGGSRQAESLFRAWVATPTGDRQLDDRSAAREAYAALEEPGGWSPPLYVREPMGTWDFAAALVRITEASAVLGLRDQVRAAAAALGLEPGATLERAYEDATDGLAEAQRLGQEELDVLTSLGDAGRATTAQPAFIDSIGLLGWSPAAAYDAARAAFEAGDLDASATGAASVLALVDGAGALGRTRLLQAAALAALVVFLVAAMVVIRARRRRGALRETFAAPVAVEDGLTTGVGAAATAAEPWPSGPYATLAADPPALPPDAAAAPDPDGGPVDGEAPSDPT